MTNIEVSCSYSTFTLGATVSGLNGDISFTSGSDPDQTFTLSGDAEWAFADPFAYGTVYDFQISEMPIGQSCTIQESTTAGTLNDGDVHFNIDCVNDIYHISGTLSGIDGTGESVTVTHGSEDVVVSADGAFAFTTEMLYSNTYDIDATAPTGYVCVVVNGIGTITMDVTNVEVTCAPEDNSEYTVEMLFTETRSCLMANSIQIAELTFYDASGSILPYSGAVSDVSYTPDHGRNEIENLWDGDLATKWVDFMMATCGNTITLSGITLTSEPHSFNIATGNDEPNRDPAQWNIEVCTVMESVVVTCKNLNYVDYDMPTTRMVYQSPAYSLESHTVTVTVVNSDGTVVVNNMNNVNGDQLTFTADGTQTFEFQVSSGSSYNVTLVDSPVDQLCSVADGAAAAVGDVNVAVYCTAGCQTPLWLDDLYAVYFPEYLGVDLCMVGNEYYYKSMPICLGGSSNTDATCDNDNLVCAGTFSHTYGDLEAQNAALLEALRTREFCSLDGEACDTLDAESSCCDPYSECLYVMETTIDFSSYCTSCTNCDSLLNDCSYCESIVDQPVVHPRCPPSDCVVTDVYAPPYVEDIEYCVSDDTIYMNGYDTCVDATQSDDAQADALQDLWFSSWEMQEAGCPNPKPIELLMDDHIAMLESTVPEYLTQSEQAVEDCCADADTLSAPTEDWDTYIDYYETQLDVYTVDITSQLQSIINGLNDLKTSLETFDKTDASST